MPRLLRYNLAPTLDGLIASAPSHATPWIVSDPTIDFAALYAEFDTFIMGRRTYETFLSLPGGENPLSGRPRGSVVVFSRSNGRGDEDDAAPEGKDKGKGGVPVADGGWREGVTVVGAKGGDEEVVDFVRGLKRQQEGKDIWLMGGGEVAGLLMRAGLVDVIEAAIMPVVVGQGVKMFGEGMTGAGEEGWKLELEKAQKLETGILMTRYRVVYD